jgi:hypothetical protein
LKREFDGKICLNMNSKTDKENRSCDDIAFLSEIIANLIFWQEIVCQELVKLGANLEHIINFAGVQGISIHH